MPAFHRSSLVDFITSSNSELTGLLSLAYARDGFNQQQTQQTLAWQQDIFRLREALTQLHNQHPVSSHWTVLLEFNIPRKLKRIDAVLLAQDKIIVLEQKSHTPTHDDSLQAEEYALLLHYFHQPSRERKIFPLVISPLAAESLTHDQNELPLTETPAYWIAPVRHINWSRLASYLSNLPETEQGPIDPIQWEAGEYRPVPTIIEAALSLQSGLKVSEIAHSRAAPPMKSISSPRSYKILFQTRAEKIALSSVSSPASQAQAKRL